MRDMADEDETDNAVDDGGDDGNGGSDQSAPEFYQRITSSVVDGSAGAGQGELMDYNFEADELYDQPRCAFPARPLLLPPTLFVQCFSDTNSLHHSMRSYPIHERATLVQAAMGVGKSEETRGWILRLCERYRREKLIIVQISHRLTFSAQVPLLSCMACLFTCHMLFVDVPRLGQLLSCYLH